MADTFLFFATDVHGSERCFRKWLNAAEAYGANVLVMGGDITGKVIVPVHRANGGFRAHWREKVVTLDGPSALEDFERRVADAGGYVWPCEPDEAAEAHGDEAAEERVFARLATERVARWVELAEQRLGDGTRAFIIAGNDDPPEVDEALAGGRKLVSADRQIVWIEDWLPMLSFGDSTPTPWNSPREVSEEEYGRTLAALAEQLDLPAGAIFNLHVPPYDSSLDLAPEVDDQLRVRYSVTGEPMQAPVGGKEVRAAIERYQPLVGLHGHVHEGRGRAKIGRTVCFNPGSDYQLGVLRGVVLRLSRTKGLRDFTFTTG